MRRPLPKSLPSPAAAAAGARPGARWAGLPLSAANAGRVCLPREEKPFNLVGGAVSRKSREPLSARIFPNREPDKSALYGQAGLIRAAWQVAHISPLGALIGSAADEADQAHYRSQMDLWRASLEKGED